MRPPTGTKERPDSWPLKDTVGGPVFKARPSVTSTLLRLEQAFAQALPCPARWYLSDFVHCKEQYMMENVVGPDDLLHLWTAFDTFSNKSCGPGWKAWLFASLLVNGHITLNTPVLVRSPKLSSVEPRQYLDGWPPGNTGCCWHSLFCPFYLYPFFYTMQKNWNSISCFLLRPCKENCILHWIFDLKSWREF